MRKQLEVDDAVAVFVHIVRSDFDSCNSRWDAKRLQNKYIKYNAWNYFGGDASWQYRRFSPRQQNTVAGCHWLGGHDDDDNGVRFGRVRTGKIASMCYLFGAIYSVVSLCQRSTTGSNILESIIIYYDFVSCCALSLSCLSMRSGQWHHIVECHCFLTRFEWNFESIPHQF